MTSLTRNTGSVKGEKSMDVTSTDMSAIIHNTTASLQ